MLEAALPPVLQQRLGATRVGRERPSRGPVCTVDPTAFRIRRCSVTRSLSSDDPQALRPWCTASRTARHLRERGVMTLLFVDPDATCYVKTRDGARHAAPAEPGLLEFTLQVVAVLADGHGRARASGRHHQRHQVRARRRSG